MGYVKETFATNWLTAVRSNLMAIEEAFSLLTGLPSVAVSSGTAAIHLGLKLLGVKAGDEVLVPTLTFVASCNPILYERARPVFLDSERRSWNLDPDLVVDALKRRADAGQLPRALIVVHLFGQSADMQPILEACRRFEVPILEDAAESLGADYCGRPVGVFGDAAAYSFNGNKIITCTGGGMLTSPHREWVEKARYWATQANDLGSKNYVHSEVGYNYRMSNVLAGIARGQLEVLPQRVEQRRAVFQRYRDGFADLPGIEPQPEASYGLHTRWLSCFLINKSEFGMAAGDLIRLLEVANIETRPVWKPMHTQPLYQKYECVGGEVAEDLNRRGICLPSSSSLTLEDQQFVIDRIREAHLRGIGKW